MCSFPELAKACSALLPVPYPTVDLAGRYLRSANMLTMKGFGRGGAQMTARDAATLLLSLLIDHERGGDFAEETKRVMQLPLFEGRPFVSFPDHFTDNLSIAEAASAGQAIESLLFDVLRDRIRLPMEKLKRDITLTVAIDPTGAVVAPCIHGPYHPEILSVGLFVYRRGPEPKKRNVERNTILHGRVLLEIAKLLELEAPT